MEHILALPAGQLLVIDVRTKKEFDSGHYSTAINIPYDQIAGRIGELDSFKHKHIVVYCHSGNRSAVALDVLRKNGFENVVNGGGYENIRKFDTR